MFRFFKQKSQSPLDCQYDDTLKTANGDVDISSIDDAASDATEGKNDTLSNEAGRVSTEISLADNNNGDAVQDCGDKPDNEAVTDVLPEDAGSYEDGSRDVSHDVKKEDEAVKSGQLSARLADAGYVLPNVAAPVAAYVPAVVLAGADKRNRLVQTSGQLPMVEGKLVATGKAGVGEGLLDAKYVYQLAKVCALNALAAAAQAAGGVDRIIGVEKVTAFVASDPTFYDQALVANGASEFFGELFDDGHARSAVGVAVLPLNAPVEVEVLFRVK